MRAALIAPRARAIPPAARPVLAAGAVGLVIGSLASLVLPWQAAPLLGWDAAGCVFLFWVWRSIAGLDGRATATAAIRQDPSAAIADVVIVIAGLACLGAVGLVLLRASGTQGGERAALVGIGVISVAISWASLHTVFTLRYARAFYGGTHGGIDFNGDDDPDYFDFAYVAFTIGLTFQVSDTNIGSKTIRRLALRHAVISFLFGAVIVGLTINVVASLLH